MTDCYRVEVKGYRITDIRTPDYLDPISIYIEDFAIGQGKITITCSDECWTHYWGAMGDKTLIEFFIKCDQHYIAKKLSRISATVVDYDEIKNHLFRRILIFRRELELTHSEARELWDSVDFANFDEDLTTEQDLICSIIGEEWYYDLPKKANSDYEYLCKIINVVKKELTLIQSEVKQ